MKVILLIIKKMEMEKVLIKMDIITLDNGKMILFMVKVYYIMKKEILYMMDNLFEVNSKVMENIIITMVVGTLGNGKTV